MIATTRLELLTLADGTRLLRAEHTPSGLAIERRISPEVPLARQKEKCFRMLEQLIASDLAPA